VIQQDSPEESVNFSNSYDAEWVEISMSLPFRKRSHAFTEYRNGRKWEKLLLLLRATSPSKEPADNELPRTGTPAEPEGSVSPHALRFQPVLFPTDLLSHW
jgi:hypothetical protein